MIYVPIHLCCKKKVWYNNSGAGGSKLTWFVVIKFLAINQPSQPFLGHYLWFHDVFILIILILNRPHLFLQRRCFGVEKMNFEGAYLGNNWADSAQIWNWGFPIPHRKFIHFCLGSDELQMHENGILFTPVKVHMRTPGFLGCTTHYDVHILI